MKKETTLKIKVQLDNANTVQELEDALENINKELEEVDENSEAFGDLTKMADEATKEIGVVTEKVKDLNGQAETLESGMESLTGVTDLFGGALGDVFNQMKTAGQSIFTLSKSMKSATTSTSGTSKAMRILKVAIASTGIGLLVIALGALVSYFTNTQKGANKVSKAMAGISATVSVLVDRLSSVGEALYNLFIKRDFSAFADSLKESFSGIGDEIEREATAAVNLEQRLQDLELREISLIESQAKKRAAISEYRLEAQQNFENSAKAAEALRNAIRLENEVAEENISIAKERADILKRQLALGESSNDEIRESAEANAVVIELEAQRNERLRGLTAELRGFTNAQKAANKAVEEMSGVLQSLSLDEEAFAYVDNFKKATEDLLKRNEEIGMAAESASDRRIERDRKRANERVDIQRDMFANLMEASNLFFKDTEEGQKKAFEFYKAVQIAETIVNTIAATQAAFKQGMKIGVPFAISSAAFAAAAGLARVASIKNTKFDSPSAEVPSGGSPPTLSERTPLTVTPNVPIFDLGQNKQEIKVFVTETDIRKTTNEVSDIYEKAVVTV